MRACVNVVNARVQSADLAVNYSMFHHTNDSAAVRWKEMIIFSRVSDTGEKRANSQLVMLISGCWKGHAMSFNVHPHPKACLPPLGALHPASMIVQPSPTGETLQQLKPTWCSLNIHKQTFDLWWSPAGLTKKKKTCPTVWNSSPVTPSIHLSIHLLLLIQGWVTGEAA